MTAELPSLDLSSYGLKQYFYMKCKSIFSLTSFTDAASFPRESLSYGLIQGGKQVLKTTVKRADLELLLFDFT